MTTDFRDIFTYRVILDPGYFQNEWPEAWKPNDHIEILKPLGFFKKWTTEPRKKPLLLSNIYWLVNRDPYFMVYETIPI